MSTAGDLPSQLTSFVGREAAVEAVSQQLWAHRLVTLTGAGGCGKTRLAIQVGLELGRTRAGDVIFFVDLSGLSDPALVPSAAVRALGLRMSAGRDPVELLTDELRDQGALLILDNCEHLVDASAALVTELVGRCRRLLVLVTSRETLGVPGEVVVRVDGLGLPRRAQPGGEHWLEGSEAGRLFLERAKSAIPGFVVDRAEAAAVAAICELLDGIPLAIELAAAQVRYMSVQSIAKDLSQRSHLLAGSGRGRPGRHKTLLASIEWSCDLLPGDERAFLHRLSVFASGFTQAAAEAVCAGGTTSPAQVISVLATLVDKSLVQAEPQADRFHLHETMRAWGAAALERQDLTARSRGRDRHLDYFRELAKGMEPKSWTSELPVALETLEPDLENLRAALDWGIESKQLDASVELVLALGNFFYILGLRVEAWARCERLLATELEPSARADVLYWASTYSRASDPDASSLLASELVALGRALGDARAVARGLCRLAFVQVLSAPEQALLTLEECLPLAHQSNDLQLVVLGSGLLGNVYRLLGQPEKAFTVAGEALRTAEEAGWLWGSAYAHNFRAMGAIQAGRLSDALEDVDALEEAGRKLSDPEFSYRAQWFRGDIYMHRAHPGAEEELQSAYTRALSCGDISSLLMIKGSLGQLWASQGRLAASYQMLGDATAKLGSLGFSRASVDHRAVMGDVAVWQGDMEAARSHLSALSGRPVEGSRDWLVPLARGRARLARAEGKPRQALALACDALEAACGSGCLRQAVELLELIAMALSDLGHSEEATRLLGTADALRERTGYARWVPISREVDTVWAKTQDDMGREAFARAIADGQALNLGSAVAYARRGRGKRTQAVAGWDSLTPSERRVATLAAQRLANAEIARELFIPPVP
ncbi:MAG TPA: AAA family ATPase [Acidimicrobiales bacterium]|nr:AAA family ATPase [Acidimicrobiales bacterium]